MQNHCGYFQEQSWVYS